MPEKLLTLGEVSALLGISEDEIKKLAKKGDLPAYRVGGQFLRFRKEQIEAIRNEIPAKLDGKVARKKRQAPLDFAQQASYSESAVDRTLDFFYFNDFYIVSAGIILLILWVIFQ